MENARPIQVLKLLGARKTWLLVGLIFLGRMVYFAYWGTLLEIDSLGYLHFQTALYHPPLYSAFCWVAMQIGRSVDAVVVAQSLFYSLCAGLLIGSWGKTWKMQVLIAFLLAVEPCSGKLACTVMAETVFLSLLMLSWLSLSGIQNTPPRQFYRAVAVSGLVLGFAYETRYAAPVFLVAILVWMIFSRLQWRRIVLAAVLIFLAFQISLLPLRSYYQLQFGTWQTNAFSSLSLWNTSAYLYPGSTLSREFKTEFEASLHQFRDGDFALYHTWHTNQMFHDSLAFQRFVKSRQMETADIIRSAKMAGATGKKLLWESPIRHLREFVWPNLKRPFWGEDHIYSNLLPAEIAQPIHFHRNQMHFYRSESWWMIFCALLLSTCLQVRFRKQMPAYAGLLLISCWLYLAGIAGLAVIFLRFVYILAPIVMLAIGLQLEALLHRKMGAGPNA